MINVYDKIDRLSIMIEFPTANHHWLYKKNTISIIFRTILSNPTHTKEKYTNIYNIIIFFSLKRFLTFNQNELSI